MTRASVTLGGLGPAPMRASAVERVLIGEIIKDKRLRDICETLRGSRRSTISMRRHPIDSNWRRCCRAARSLQAHERVVAGSRA